MQVPDDVRKCVGFLLFKDSKTGKNEYKLAGTGFFIGFLLIKDCMFSAGYFVTAKHVIQGIKENSIDQKVYIRINKKGAEANIFEFGIEQFFFHPDDEFVDIAAIKFAPDPTQYDYQLFPFEKLVSKEII